MPGMNKVILIGNLGADPQVREIEGGVKVANLSVACTETWRDKDGNKQTHTEWVRCVLWRGQAETAERYLHKGDAVYFCGRFRSRKWTDNDGVERYTTEVQVDEMQMLGGKANGNGGAPERQPGEDDNLPFDRGTQQATSPDDVPDV